MNPTKKTIFSNEFPETPCVILEISHVLFSDLNFNAKNLTIELVFQFQFKYLKLSPQYKATLKLLQRKLL
jgi:hypothetical protein